MENNTSISRIDQQDQPSVTLRDIQHLANTCDSLIDKVTASVTQMSTSYLEVKRLASQVELETKRIEGCIDALMIKAQRDVKLYESSLPMLDKQFTIYQQRMDKLMDKAMDMLGDDFSDENIARHEAALKLIEITNDGLNRLMSKLIPQY